MQKSNTNVNRSLIESKTNEILSCKLGYEIKEINGTSLLEEDLGLDSFDALRIIFEIEDEFDISIPPTEIENVKTLEDVYKHIEKRVLETGK